MRAYAANGNRAKAAATYHEFRELLAYNVGTDPEPELGYVENKKAPRTICSGRLFVFLIESLRLALAG